MRQVEHVPRVSKPIWVILLAMCLLLPTASSCKEHPPPPSPSPERRINAPHRSYQTVEFCPDFTVSTEYTREAVPAVADNIVADTTVNQDGATIFVTPVTDDTLRNTLDPITIPALSADSQEPVYQAIPQQSPNEDPLAYKTRVAQIQNANHQAHDNWQEQLRANHQKLAEAIQKVQAAVQPVQRLHVPTVNITDLYGCYKSASNHFLEHPAGKHVLILDGDLMNTTDLHKSDQISLADASIVVIWYYCQVASVCDANQAHWQEYFLQHGAWSVQFYDKASSEGLRDTHKFFF